nr:MAG TPA: hypothetical protein [Caudoviricetes sp.]
MFLVRSQKAILRQYNRTKNTSPFDDRNYRDIIIKCCPYDADSVVRFGVYTVEEAKGYYQVPRNIDVKAGDQIHFIGNYKNGTFDEKKADTILEVQDGWLFNRIENYILAVK